MINNKLEVINNYFYILSENINFQKVEYCYEFHHYFFQILLDNFLGTDAFSNREELSTYTYWVLEKTCKYFEEIYNINLLENKNLFIYLEELSYTILYNNTYTFDTIVSMFKNLFTIKKNKKQEDVSKLLEIYFIFFKKD
jgi:hypothetical protein